MTHVPLGFVPEPLAVPLDKILCTRKAPSGLAVSRKFRQIRSSIEEVGLIEPLSVTPADQRLGQHILLDGHMRIIALRELGYHEARRHLAEVCRLTHQKLRTWASARPPEDEANDQPIVDLVLFPELSVHPEHLSHLRTLSDKLRANIFAGLTFQHSATVGAPINQGIWLIRTESPGSGRTIQYAWQGKKHPIKAERDMGVKGYRPHITLVEFPIGEKTPTRVAAAICYDATDLDLLADLRDRSDMFLVAALNQDVETFDNMVAALRFHMYQPVVLANLGEFGGSTAQAPLPKHEKIIAHVHGNSQVAVSVFEIDPSPFKSNKPAKAAKEVKGAPAGYKGRPRSGI